ncbi:MAG TPA: WcaI family glycosyltransferase [Candidatus Ozemobacteraceae bacterium]|nr:WcaI family glycosyltransferase [Candidatus Ozemobacteraceae bacterium]
MQIVIHALNFHPEEVGCARYNTELALWLARRGHRVKVVTTPPYYPWWQVQPPYLWHQYRHETLDNLDIYRCPLWVPRQPTGSARIWHLLSFGVSSLPYAFVPPWQGSDPQFKPDLVFTVQPTLFGAFSALLMARRLQAKAWLHVQDFELEAALATRLIGLKKGGVLPIRVANRLERFFYTRFHRLSVISRTMAQRLADKGLPEEKIVYLPNWVDTNVIRPLSRDSIMRHELGLSISQRVVLYSGNMGRKQGLDIILRIAPSLARSHPDLVFLLVGDGSGRADLKADVRRRGLTNVRFAPLQPVAKLNDLLNLADLHLVLLTHGVRDSVLPSKLTTILAAGGVAIASAEPGTELMQLISRHQCARAVPPEDEAALRTAITSLLADSDRCRAISAAARRLAESQFSIDSVLPRFETQCLRYLGLS